jgi:hypothetical protein
MNLRIEKILVFILYGIFLLQCQSGSHNKVKEANPTETTLEEALKEWPEMPQQITFIGLKECPAKFQVYWNGALSCFVGRDCFGHVFPPQKNIARQYEKDQLHMTFAGGEVPDFPVIDSGQVYQTLLDGYLPVVETSWITDDILYSLQTLASSLVTEELNPEVTAEMTLGLTCVKIAVPESSAVQEVHLWINFSGYKILVPTDKELPDDVFPLYGRKLHLEGKNLIDDNNLIRAAINDLPQNSTIEFYHEYNVHDGISPGLKRSLKKGFLNNLMHIRIPCMPGETVSLIIALPYFPIKQEKDNVFARDYKIELEKIRQYWQYFYEKDAVLETPDPFVNNFYKAGLWHTLVTADKDPVTNLIYAKLSPAWYETFWPNCTMIIAVSLDNRGYHEEAKSYLQPFLDWQGIREPPNMSGASKEGFLCPPEEFCPIPWVSNHGNTLWALCEHYRMTGDSAWADRITDIVLKASDWIIKQRILTKENGIGSGLLPGGTVSDDKGSGQYLSTDAQTYRGLQSAADFLRLTGHTRAEEIQKAAESYQNDIQKTISKAIERTNRIKLSDGEQIPYVPSEIHQIGPPEFDKNDFWPYINYADVGPMYLIDCNVIESNSAIAGWIYAFESRYRIASLRNIISIRENWVHSIRFDGNVPAYLLHHDISTIEPFYSSRSTMFYKNDQIAEYINLFYNQLAAGVSHKNLSPCENRYGVWFLPWADAEFHRMLFRMLVDQEGDKLVLLKAIPKSWLGDGKQITVENQPTEYGNISFHVISNINQGIIEMNLNKAEISAPDKIEIRLRHPYGYKIKSVEINGKTWDKFNWEYIFLTNTSDKIARIKIHYKKYL